MKLFDLMDSELEFLKQGLALYASLPSGIDVAGSDCIHCESVCASGCGANCSGANRSCYTA